MPFNVDPALPVPVGTQLRGVIEYGIVCGQLAPGLRLPTVRRMAQELGIAPMTVSQVYKELKAAGLLDPRSQPPIFRPDEPDLPLEPTEDEDEPLAADDTAPGETPKAE